MALPVLIIGESGTGKSTSLRNFKKDEITLINVEGKPLPFKGRFGDTTNTDDYDKIKNVLKNTEKKIVVIDDVQYLMANEFMGKANEKGYDKFTTMAYNFWNLINSVRRLPEDLIVYFLIHPDTDTNGRVKAKTIGKMIDEKITLEGMFTIVLGTQVTKSREGCKYSFITQNNGNNTLKSPMGMFDYEIDNDLKLVDSKIREYYELGEIVGDVESVPTEPVEAPKSVAETLAEQKTAPEPTRRRSSRVAEPVIEDVVEDVVETETPSVEEPIQPEVVKVEPQPTETPVRTGRRSRANRG